MRIALLYDPWLLSARGTLDLEGYRDDPRGMTGSEQCAVRLFEELKAAGHEVVPFWPGKGANRWELRGEYEGDLAISINCPDPLRDVRAKFKVCYTLLNDFTFCKAGFEQHVDLFVSPSAPHLEQVMTNPAWRRVEMTPSHPDGKGRYEPDPSKWEVVPLGCDPERYQGVEKVPGRVVYCSSPDRGLHWLLQEWAAIKRAVPHAHLKIFYRLEPWLRQFDQTPYFPPIEPLRARANYIEDALRRLRGYDIEVCDSVSRAQIEREMAEAEVLAYPCDTTTWSEGFSCTVLEACAARACPVITDCDAIGAIYADCALVAPRENRDHWRNLVVKALTDAQFRGDTNDRAERFAKEHKWKNTAEKLMAAIQAHSSK
jgi:glycosyltransferase involved in cell wall biosynthesis